MVADTSLTTINAVSIAPAPPASSTLNFTSDGVYERRRDRSHDSTSKKDAGTWKITNPKANTPLTGTTMNDLVLIAHYEVALV